MSLTHPVFPPANNAATNLPTAFAQINAALRALDGTDTLVIDAGATALDTVLPRLPQVLAVHGTPGSLDGSGHYVLRLPSNGAVDQVLIVANRTAVPLRLVTADGANALVASLAAGRLEAYVLSGSTVGAYALSSARTGKANASHTHPVSEITGLPATVRRALRRANSSTDISPGDWHSLTFAQNVFDDLGLTWTDANRTFTIPSGITRLRLSAAIVASTASPSIDLSFSRNAAALTGASAWGSFEGNVLQNGFSILRVSTGWFPVTAGDYFRVISRRIGSGGISVISSERTWISVEAL